jgi:hypothetical protein
MSSFLKQGGFYDFAPSRQDAKNAFAKKPGKGGW